MQCRSEGTQVTDAEAAAIVELYGNLYKDVHTFLEETKRKVKDPGFVTNPFGRIFRFAKADEGSYLAHMERQACNAPIQSCVADAVNVALANLYAYRPVCKIPYKVALQVNSASLTSNGYCKPL